MHFLLIKKSWDKMYHNLYKNIKQHKLWNGCRKFSLLYRNKLQLIKYLIQFYNITDLTSFDEHKIHLKA